MENRSSKLLQLIDEKIIEAKRTKTAKRSQSPSTRAESNRQNGAKSTGPKTADGKAKASANSLKHGFFANVKHLNPHDAPAYQQTHHDLRLGLQPDGPVEEQLIRELAMFTTRLQRLEAAEYALLAGNTDSDPSDAREIAAAFQRCAADLEALHKIEVHLRRAYNRTFDRLQAIQKERHKLPLDESLKRSQRWLTYYAEKGKVPAEPERTGRPEATPKVSSVVRDQETEAQRNNRPQDIPSRHPALNEKGKFPKYPEDHPLFRPKDEQSEQAKPSNKPDWEDHESDWKDIDPK